MVVRPRLVGRPERTDRAGSDADAFDEGAAGKPFARLAFEPSGGPVVGVFGTHLAFSFPELFIQNPGRSRVRDQLVH